MDGYALTFFTQQDRRLDGKPLGEWLMALARELGLPGATLIAAAQGLGHDHRLHSAGFFELADQPQIVHVVADAAQCDALLARLAAAGAGVFYTKAAVEFGVAGAAPRA